MFDSIKIGLASPEMIRSWSYGEVRKPETINYRTLKPERDGLFCERIFGPTKDWECLCGKYKRVRYKGKICEKCGVEVTSKKVRRERMGHIDLAAPVSHIWYFRAIPSRMGLLLDISPRVLERVLYFAQYIVIDPGDTPLEKHQAFDEREFRMYYERYEDSFRVGMGAEAIKELLSQIDIPALSKKLQNDLLEATGQKKLRIIKRLEVVEAFRRSGNKPEWMILDVIPVIPPELRPMVQLDGGRFASSDLNDLYRRVINRNNRLHRLLDLRAPDIIIRNEKRMLQEAVDALIDNGRRGKPVTGPNNRPLKSLSEMLRGKQGRFRQNLLGKRVDYSGRSVIVVGPDLKFYQCGLPKEMALELFKPFVMKRLVESQKASNIKDAKKKVERVDPAVWDALEVVIKEHPVLLNRAPTLHRLSIQAFEPVLVEGKAIKLHPLVCTAFNADFDGDQMPVHVPLSAEAQAEARFLMLSANNLLKPADGRAVTIPSQDMVLGSYYLTISRPGEVGEGKVFRDYDEACMAYDQRLIGLHAPIKVRRTMVIDGVEYSGIIDATMGQLIFNYNIPQDLGFVDRTDPERRLDLEITEPATMKLLAEVIDRCIKHKGVSTTVEVLDKVKATGYKYCTLAAISISIADITIPPEKHSLIEKSEKEVDKIYKQYQNGLLNEEERYNNVIKEWEKTTDAITTALQNHFNKYNPIKMMADSGARGSMTQMRQLAGMRGLMYTATGKTIEIPIKSNFREGLKILEYFTAARGARKALSDTALKTADSGYLTRRLVDVSQEVIVREEDCGTVEGLDIEELIDEADNKTIIESFRNRISGRYVLGDVIDPNTGEVIIPDGTLCTPELAAKAEKAGVTRAKVRSILYCKSRNGVCAHCYGSDLATGKAINMGEAVGIIAAQSIGEPGTQLTLRNFHTGGVAGKDITQGLPRVEEVFEARRPKHNALMADIAGVVSIEEIKKTRTIVITNEETGETVNIPTIYDMILLVKEGDYVEKGQALTEGQLYPADILRINGLEAVYEYIIKEVQKVYASQSIGINDRHIEVIARQMTRKVRIESSGDTDMLVGSTVNINEYNDSNAAIAFRNESGEVREDGEPLKEAVGSRILLGITKAALMTESFLSAASFQETTKVLTEAAIHGKVDNLLGLKENVIIGKLIPAGTGMEYYRNIEVEKVDSMMNLSDEFEE